MIIGIEDDLNLGSPRKGDQTMPLSYKAIDNTYAQAFSVTILINTTQKKKKTQMKACPELINFFILDLLLHKMLVNYSDLYFCTLNSQLQCENPLVLLGCPKHIKYQE